MPKKRVSRPRVKRPRRPKSGMGASNVKMGKLGRVRKY